MTANYNFCYNYSVFTIKVKLLFVQSLAPLHVHFLDK